MKKFFVVLSAITILAGCASNPQTPTATPARAAAPITASVDTNQAAELQALRAVASPAAVAMAVTPVPVVPRPVAAVVMPAPVTPAPVAAVVMPPPVAAVVQASKAAVVQASKAAKSHKVIFWLLTTIFAVPLTWAVKKYGMPLFKKLLAWLKSHNIIADIKTLASEAETKVESLVKDVEAKIEPAKPATTPPALAVAHAATTPAPVTTATHAFAVAETKKP